MLKFTYISIICAIALLLLFVNSAPLLWYMVIILIWLGITALGSFSMSMNYHVNAYVSHKQCKEKKIAITFDDGPHERFTPEVLNVLAKHQMKATFFCIGKQIEQHPDIVERILKEGHTIGNHSYSHSNRIGFFSSKRIIEEITRTNNLVASLFEKKMRLFRPPYGVTNPAIAKAIKHTKHHVIGWNIRPFDTVQKDEQKVLRNIKKRVSPGSVILLHDTNCRTSVVLEQLLVFLLEEGYQTVTINELFSIEAYA